MWNGNGMANGMERIPFRRNGTEQEHRRFYASYCMYMYIVLCSMQILKGGFLARRKKKTWPTIFV